MTTLALENEPLAAQIRVTDEKLIVDLVDGRSLIIPLSWYPRLRHASYEERQNWQLLGDGYAIEWVDLDEHIGVEGLLAGRQSGESDQSFERWLVTRDTSLQFERANNSNTVDG
ncbi:hypothetical protein GlitD10_2129 [Gloeomargarita lithophora Alchichica-D10]|uniref:DUF2442 domain-containing protein n=1 Tax=Gloeomargarita lithophora Alchichica-D10 TaxID=1188229 RepID=A0A1J0AET9_9CYAN|nr:DUF2442 domain-containing protein [Gloeomargarita lithophora]APB34458.1 hypothetical protein GlitD10_2129 [Gloeomargarita lithophora Alchichica-D10]